MSKILYKPPTENIKYGYFIYYGGEKLILWGHGSTPPYRNYNDLENIVRSDFESVVNIFANLNSTILMPLLPRDSKNKKYPQFKMDSQILTQETMNLVDGIEPDLIYLRPDLEIKKIIDLEFGINRKYIAGGISAGANMANRYSLLNPVNIQAITLLSAGDFIYPVKELNGVSLNYPFGLADVDNLESIKIDIEKYKTIPQYIFVGENDLDPENDPLPYELNNNIDNIEKFRNLFGANQVERTINYTEFLKSKGFNVTLSIGYDLSHELDALAVNNLRDWVDRL